MKLRQIHNQGIAIIAVYAVLIILIILSGVFMARTLTEGRLSAKERDSARALEFAKEGVACAIQESEKAGYQWWTHQRVGQVLNPLGFPGHTLPDTKQDVNNYAAVNGRFQVKTFADQWSINGDTVILSRGVSNNAIRILAVKLTNSGGIAIWVGVTSFDVPPTL